ncbi:LacI family DNA-binding transcriptional regulator [Deinococcus marmoris]|uniref:Ribose operon repressor n=1 Tax=Deinococcus marmoris TaxID=249408 RepID=A0A1U7NUV4_9DEIO|nr:LacI family DNA-binding transcriptional regulator [Deinococcus marmoris]OLV16701.1 Ribose operon repressor [Deinococcus marmoris]
MKSASAGPPTLRHVAQASQVSESTVSKIVNRTKRFSPEVERRVQAAVAELGYTPNPHARSVITGRSRTIGVVVADVLNPHFALLIKGVGSVARARGYTVLLTDSDEDSDLEAELLGTLIPRVDGLIVAPRLEAQVVAQFARLKPLALTARPSDLARRQALGEALTFGVDGFQTGQMIGHYLAQGGHRHVSYLHLAQADDDRLRGLEAALGGQGIRCTVHRSAEPSIEGGLRAATAMLLGEDRPDAVVTYNDLMALGVLAEARKFGFEVPRDFSLVGVDDIPYAALTSPPLTTVRTYSREIGVQLAEALLDRIEGVDRLAPTPPTPQLMVRGSSAPRQYEAAPVGRG